MNCKSSIVNRQLWWRVSFLLVLCIHCFVVKSDAQIENVPVNNQVYEFLNRMGVKRILLMYSNTMIPISRKEVAEFLIKVDR